MKADVKTKSATAAAIVALTFGALLQSCATENASTAASRDAGNKPGEALVCPQCKMVAVPFYRPIPPYVYYPGFPGGFPGWSTYAWGGLSLPPTTYEDRCPGCQGAITTFVREGKLQHRCSICREKPFKCPVPHPISQTSS